MTMFNKSKHFNKLLLIKEYLNLYSNILYKIIQFYYIIEQEHAKFNYIYKNIKYISIDNYLIRTITDLNLNLVTISLNDKFKLEYNSNIFDKFIYIISITINSDINIEICETIVNQYLPKIINNGNKYDIINACLLSFYVKNNNQNIIMNFDYYQGLIKCLNLSPRWDEFILYFHNKQLVNKFDLRDVFNDVTRYLLTKNDGYYYNIMIDLLGEKSDFMLTNFQ